MSLSLIMNTHIYTLGCQTHQQVLYLQVYLSFVKVIKSLKTIEMPLESMHSKKLYLFTIQTT